MHDPAIYIDEDSGPLTPAPPPEVVVAAHYVSGAQYRVQRPNGTRDWLITFTRAGAGSYQLGAYQHICCPGDVVLLPPGTPHHYGTDTTTGVWDFYWAHFQPRPTWSNWLDFPERAPGLRAHSVADPQAIMEIEQAFQRLLHTSQGAGAWHAALSENALEEVIIIAAHEAARASAGAIDTRVATVMQTIRNRYHEPLSVSTLAQLVGLSPSRLAHLFKAETGVALVETIIALRLRHAARLLEFTDLPISTIAAAVGFESSFYFSRQFRARYGYSPRAYRQRIA